MNVFLDTSAFAKRYLTERGSEKVNSVLLDADQLAVSVLCVPEFVSTLSRLVREERLRASERDLIKALAIADLADADICQITPEVVASAVTLIESTPLRTLDAIHIASAASLKAELFVTADRRQLSAARAAGLQALDVS